VRPKSPPATTSKPVQRPLPAAQAPPARAARDAFPPPDEPPARPAPAPSSSPTAASRGQPTRVPPSARDGFQQAGKEGKKLQQERDRQINAELESTLANMGFPVDDRVREIMKSTKDLEQIVERLLGGG